MKDTNQPDKKREKTDFTFLSQNESEDSENFKA